MKTVNEVKKYIRDQIRESRFEIKVNNHFIKSVERDDLIIEKRKKEIIELKGKIKKLKEALKQAENPKMEKENEREMNQIVSEEKQMTNPSTIG